MNRFLVIPLFLFALSTSSCQNSGKLMVLADMPSSLKENSGLAYFGKNHVWAIEDSGNKDEIYAVNFKGKIVKSFEVKNAGNEDWEDLTTDKNGNLYVGDFGDNGHDRRELVIYKLPNPELEKGDKINAERIAFSYEDGAGYNTESIFHWDGSLYVVTKNQRKFSGKAKIFKLPDSPGKHRAKLVSEVVTCTDYGSCAITSADVSKDGSKIILLSNGFLWTISNFSWDDFSTKEVKQYDLKVRTQLEAACFLNDSTLLLSDEKSHSMGGNLYLLDLTKL